jgi:zinc D-Ala-D-Ala carboxypeptidase
MAARGPAQRTTRRISRISIAGPVVAIAAIALAFGYQLLASSSSTAALLAIPASSTSSTPASLPSSMRERLPLAQSPGDGLRSHNRGALGEAGGDVPAGTTVFADGIPAIAKLDPSLLKSLRQAATDAAKDGVIFQVNSGWRSPEYQEQLFRDAVSEYGSEAEAARWVAMPNTSAHVSGDAVDLGPFEATAWLSEHGARYGLCQLYRNEPWHYELRPEATRRGCPAMYADPTHRRAD